MALSQKVVGITGAAGIVASAVRPGLEQLGYKVIGIDRPVPKLQGGPGLDPEELVNLDAVDRVCDFSDSSSCANIFEGCTHVLHLAGQGDPSAPFAEDILPNNVQGMFNACEAAKAAGVERFVFASTNHTQHGGTMGAAGFGSLDVSRLATFAKRQGKALHDCTDDSWGVVRLDDAHANSSAGPDSFYAVSKLFGEQLGCYYGRVQRAFDFVALRIGWCMYDDPTVLEGTEMEAYLRAVWLSRRDCLGFVRASLECDARRDGLDGCLVAYAVSKNGRAMFDARESEARLGYTAIDNAEDFPWSK
jgi:nucleoside-diphosphate-sugar epimerase